MKSGIIIHKSDLQLLIHLLRSYSTTSPLIPSEIHRRAPDQVVQDCLIGRPASLCERLAATLGLAFHWWSDGDVTSHDPGRRGNMVIGSKIVLDHIGGMATTQVGKSTNSD